MRTYTIRNHRPGEIDVDFVVHDGGVAANWAGHAHVGDELGLNAPKELYNLPANATHQVLIADEPALPAALRIAELSAGQVTTHIVCEVRNAQNKIEPSMPGTRYTWLQGSGNGARPSQLAHIVRTLDLDSSGTTYVWVAGETRMTREIRTYLRKTLGLPNPAYKVVGYWTDKSEQWMQRYEALDQSVKDQIDELIANAEDLEVALDQVNEIYTRVGL
jgi:NADPH-dependent ferric siderophore reductase